MKSESTLRSGAAQLSTKYQCLLSFVCGFLTLRVQSCIESVLHAKKSGIFGDAFDSFVGYERLQQCTLLLRVILCFVVILIEAWAISNIHKSIKRFTTELRDDGASTVFKEKSFADRQKTHSIENLWMLKAHFGLSLLEACMLMNESGSPMLDLGAERKLSAAERFFLYCTGVCLDSAFVADHFLLSKIRYLVCYTGLNTVFSSLIASFSATDPHISYSSRAIRVLQRYYTARFAIHVLSGLFISGFSRSKSGHGSSGKDISLFLESGIPHAETSIQLSTKYMITLLAIASFVLYFHLILVQRPVPKQQRDSSQEYTKTSSPLCSSTLMGRMIGLKASLLLSWRFILLPFLASLTAVVAMYSLSTLISIIITFSALFLVSITLSSALVAPNFDSLGLASVLLIVFNYSYLSHSIISCILKCISTSMVLTFGVHSISLFHERQLMDLALFLLVILVPAFSLCCHIQGGVSEVIMSHLITIRKVHFEPILPKLDISSVSRCIQAAIVQIHDLSFSAIFREIPWQRLLFKIIDSSYEALFVADASTLMVVIAAIAVLVVVRAVFSKLKYVRQIQSITVIYSHVLLSAIKYLLIYFIILAIHAILRSIPLVSRSKNLFLLIALFCLLIMVGIQQEMEELIRAIAIRLFRF